MKILVIGASRSGKAAALLACKQNYDVFVTENQGIEKFLDTIYEFEQNDVSFEFERHSFSQLNKYDLAVSSPGIPRDADIIKELKKNNIKIISEVEFAYQFCKNPIIAVTGTNGKTTTTSLITHILNESGKKAISAGNIGKAFSEAVLEIDDDTVVSLEVSSYQLDRIDKFHPNVAVITNISPDHLNYHGTMEDYVETKWKINRNQNEKDLLILNYDNEWLQKSRSINGKVQYFSLNELRGGAFVRKGQIILDTQHKEEEIMPISQIGIKGQHNLYNSLAAILATRSFEITNENYRSALSSFAGVEHRLEYIRTINGVEYYNDSKATNVNSTWFALNSFSSPIIWIAGGRGDNNNYEMLDSSVRKNVKSIICIGEEAESIYKHFSSIVPCQKFQTLEEAVFAAYNIAKEDEIVLFSPACKSFDMFANFEHRGEIFKQIVKKLPS